MMGLEEKLDREIKESAEFRGEMRQFAKNMGEYVGAVRETQRMASVKLDAHIADISAHGLGVIAKGEEKASKSAEQRIALWVAIFTAVGLLIEIVRMAHAAH